MLARPQQKWPSDGRDAHSKGTSAPRTSATDLSQVSQQPKRRLVAQWHVDEAMVRQRRHHGDGSALLAASHTGTRDKQTDILAPEGAGLPLSARAVPEGLPLGWHVAEASRYAEEEGVVGVQVFGTGECADGRVFGRRVHLGQDSLGEGLCDSAVDVSGLDGMDWVEMAD